MFSAIVSWDAAVRDFFGSMGWPLESIFRLVLAAIAGGLVGLDRELRGREAGFRTNILVCLGSALVMLVSTHFAVRTWPHAPGININIDPARIAYGVMTGIGFLGAGTIVHSGGIVRGLTTAAGMWCVAAIGLSVGFGLYVLAAAAVLLVVMALWILDYVEEALPKRHDCTLKLRVPYRVNCLDLTVNHMREMGLHVHHATFERREDAPTAMITLHVAFPNKRSYYEFEKRLAGETQYQLASTEEL